MNTSSNSNPKKITCSLSELWKMLGKTWALIILKNIFENETSRFNEIKKAIPQISNTVLSERLRELEEYGLIQKKVYAEVPIRVEYKIVKQTSELGKILMQLDEWATKWEKQRKK